jgi:N-acetylneuraminic acid mutarotase
MKTPLQFLAVLAIAISLCEPTYSQPPWTQSASLGNGATPRYNACAMAIGTKGYIGTGYFNSNFYNDFFEFDATPNTWTQKSSFGGDGRSGVTSFVIGTKGYFATGYNGTVYKNDLWEYDQTTNSWSQKANFPGGPRNAAAAFAIGTKGYLGTGYDGTNRKNDFWEYDQPTNTWTQKANYAGGARSSAAGFTLNSKGYIGIGYDGTNRKKDFYLYDPVANTWTQKTDFGGTARSNAVSFAIGSKGYIGTGLDGTYRNDFWEYDPTANTWIQKANFGAAGRYNASGFSIGTKGYIGTGFDGNIARYDFFEYNQQNNTWTEKSIFGGYARSGAISFTINSKSYMGSGYDGVAYKNDLWEYDPINNAWAQKANLTTGRADAVAFTINNKGYAGTGYNGVYLNDFWEYDATANSWTQKANYGGTARKDAVGFPIGTKGYVGTGTTGSSKNDFWEFDPVANSWTQKALFPGGIRQEACGFGLGTKGYLTTGADNDGTFYDDFWEFDPTANTWTQKTDFPGGTRRGAVATTLNGLGYIATGFDELDHNDGDVWEYNAANDGWTRKADFGGSARSNAICFTVNGNTYIGFGDDGTIFKNDLWKFNPSNSLGAPATFCAGATVAVPFSSGNFFLTGNVFTAQLSNASGSFGSPVTIGSLNGTVSGTISVTIPPGTAAGSNYLIRIVASNPSQTIITSSPITINTPAIITSCPSNASGTTTPLLCTALIFYNNATASGTPSPSINYSKASGTLFNGGTTVVTVTATNSCAVATCNFNVTVTDNQPPTISCPLPASVNASSGQCGASGANLGTPVTLDNCGIASVVNNAPPSIPVGVNTVTWTVTDVNGNTANCGQTVTVTDNQNPVITCPPNVAVNTNPGQCSATGVTLGTATATDNCGIATITKNAPTTFPVGITSVVWTATDVNGRTATCTQTVTVTDNQAPVVTCPNNITVNAANGQCSATGVNLGSATASDNCGIANITNNAPSSFAIGVTSVVWTATDVNGKTGTCTQTVTVVDNQNPVITCPSNVTVNATNGLCSASGVALGTPVTSDNCGIASVTNNAPASFPIGNTSVIWTATDVNGKKSTCTQTVTVIDNQSPVFSGCPANINTSTNPVTWTAPTASDNCGIASVTTNHNPGETFPTGTTTVTYTATDVNGKTATCSFTVTITATAYTISASGPLTFCKPATVTLTVTPAAISYKWFKGTSTAIAGATNISFTATATASYFCKVTGSSGTFNTNTVAVTANAQPSATINPSGTVNICAGQSVTLQANTGTGLSYTWLKGTATIAGATTSNFVTTQAAQYKVTVKNTAGCSKTSPATKVAITCKEEVITDNDDLNVFPNPTTGTLTVSYSLESNENAVLQVNDLLGRVVYQQSIHDAEGSVTLDLGEEPSGLYFIRMITNAKTEVRRFEITM